jgi:hypothetical protein
VAADEDGPATAAADERRHPVRIGRRRLTGLEHRHAALGDELVAEALRQRADAGGIRNQRSIADSLAGRHCGAATNARDGVKIL